MKFRRYDRVAHLYGSPRRPCERVEMLPYIPKHLERILELGGGIGFSCQPLKAENPRTVVWSIGLGADTGRGAIHNVDKVFIGDSETTSGCRHE